MLKSLSVNYNFYFYYKYCIRHVLLNKLISFTNIYNIPYIKRLVFFFSASHLEDLSDPQLYIIFTFLNFFLAVSHFVVNINLIYI